MQIRLLPTMSLFFIITIFFLRHPTFANAQRYQNCSGTFDCGNFTGIGYPFWGSNRPDYCGHPNFQLNCTSQAAEITIEQQAYQVLEIDTDLKNLKVVRTDYIGDVCPANYRNTSLDWDVFEYASDTQNITLYYGCPDTGHIFIQQATFSCNDTNGLFATREITSNETIINYMILCTDRVIVQGSQSAVQSLESGLNPTQDKLVAAIEEGFGLGWNANDSFCDSCTSSGGACGYNTTANSFACYCSDNQTQPFSCGSSSNQDQLGSNSNLPLKLGIGLGIAVATIISALLGLCYFIKRPRFLSGMATKLRRKNPKQDEKIEAFIVSSRSLMPKRYSYSDIRKMTNSFSEKLGQGGFGSVYKGKLSDGRPVAVKLLIKSIGDGEEFINEVASFSRTSHVNVVTLLGFCYERTKRALVYQYMPNGSLDKFICNQDFQNKTCCLDQEKLCEIAIGIARGLEYLHRGCNTRIVHFDIKPHNILLDVDFCPKIADFGLAKLCKGKESIMSLLSTRGTIGYIAPEVFMRSFGPVSYKSDVYSYGMMILEMFGGRNNTDNGQMQTSEMYFPDWIYKYLETGKVPINGENITEVEEETVKKMSIVGLWCIQTNPSNRPSMTKVIEMLEGNLESLEIPPNPLLLPSLPTAIEFSTLSSTVHAQPQTERLELIIS